MELTTHKEIKIEISQDGHFRAEGIGGWHDTLAKAEREIDRVLSAETKKDFPVEAISTSMRAGKITSMNTYTKDCWFAKEGGERSKERITDYRGGPKFYTKNESNLKLVKRYEEIDETVSALYKEQRTLEKGLTEPIVFPAKEEK